MDDLQTDERPVDRGSVGEAGPTRRLVLTGALAAGGMAVLAACGGGSDETSPGSPSPAETDAGDGAGAAAGGEALVPAADVPIGGGVIVSGAGVVVTQPNEGEFRGFSSTCTHQGCQVSSVQDGAIQCLCHASAFSVEDGSVLSGPAPAPLPEVGVTVEGEEVFQA